LEGGGRKAREKESLSQAVRERLAGNKK
jgi:hypothetical protein